MITIIYDGYCPLCSDYIQRLRLIESSGPVHMVDARAETAIARSYWAQGYNLDEGMIVVIGNAVYYGAEAATALARLSSNNRLFYQICHWLLSHGAIARLAYPLMKACRRIALRIKGRKGLSNPINPVDPPHR